MGIEDERLVLDYLSRVGDLAHGTGMPAAERAALVNRLRTEIGRRRTDQPVRRVLNHLGRPEDVVAEAAARPARPEPPAAPPPARPTPPAGPPAAGPPATPPPAGPPSTARPVPGPRGPADPAALAGPPAAPAVPPGLFGLFGQAPRGEWPDGDIGRFVGGIEIPELLRPSLTDPEAPVTLDKPTDAAEAPAAPDAAPDAAPGAAGEARPSPGRRLARAALAGKRVGGPVELLAAALLVGGTVAGSVVVLALGWLAAYWSPKLSRAEAQWATFGMPGTVAGGYLLWLLGRAGGYWGEALAEGEAEEAFADHWPWLLRGAALASAVFLLWRARRRVPPPAAS